MRPVTEAELAEMVGGVRGPVQVRGGGTRGLTWRGPVLETGGLSGIRLYEPGALTLVAAAGTALAEVEAALAADRQRLAFEPPDLRAVLGRDGVSTIGGVVAANAAGPRRVQVGAARDAALGVRFVDGTGAVVKNGGRVMKNVTGYDLVKLLAGSRGQLGVITEVALKVQALPQAEATLVVNGLDDAGGLAVLRRAQGSPFDVSGVARAGGQSLIRVEGMRGSVAYRVGRLREAIAADVTLVEGADSAALWRSIRDLAPLIGRGAALWRIACVPTVAGVVPAALTAAGVDHAVVWDCGGAVLHLACATGQGGLIRAALAGQGQATRLKGAEDAPALPPMAPAVAGLEAGLRARFDPRGVFAMGELA